MQILFITWEIDPFFKRGGLGDISRSLPIALHKEQVDIRLAVPMYKIIKFKPKQKVRIVTYHIKYGNRQVPITIYRTFFHEYKIPIYFFHNKEYFDVPDKETFLVFNLAIVEAIKRNLLNWQPNIIHCNDHHAGLMPLLIQHEKLPIKTLLTLHNLSYQGETSLKLIHKLHIPVELFHPRLWETQERQINLLKEGIIYADKINAVSPTYAEEILTEEYGENLNETLEKFKHKISGILNGIDYSIRNTINDPFLKHHYEIHPKTKNIHNVSDGKALNKEFLQKKVGFDVDPDIPLIGFIGRISPKQKGIELMHRLIRRLNLDKYQFVLIGRGNIDWEERFTWLAQFNPKHVHYSNEFSEPMASYIYAGCDFIMIPSRFEPCGLIQMIAMKYGCLPIARATGGLKDSIDDNVNGFLFEKYSSQSLETAVKEACRLMHTHPKTIQKMRINAMEKDFSWKKSAQEYINLYQQLIET